MRTGSAPSPISEETVTPADVSESTDIIASASRWRGYLLEHSPAFRELQEERELGWRSPALDAWYNQRGRPPVEATKPSTTTRSAGKAKPDDATVGSSERAEELGTRKRGRCDTCATPSGSQGTSDAARTKKASALAVTTSFAEADVATLAERYRVHARRITTDAAPTFFRPFRGLTETSSAEAEPTTVVSHSHHNSSASSSVPTFLDLGCAPGGVSKYLLKDLHWTGIGVTLAPSAGGIDVDPALLQANEVALQRPLRSLPPLSPPQFVLLYGDVSASPATWCAASSSSSCPASLDTDEEDSLITRAKAHRENAASHAPRLPLSPTTKTKEGANESPFTPGAITSSSAPYSVLGKRFTFVNGGAVQDHGQRLLANGNAKGEMASNAVIRGLSPAHGTCALATATDGMDCMTMEANESACVQSEVADGIGTVACPPHSPVAVGAVPTPILPWLSLFVPQLELALNHVADDGAMMLVYGAPHCASFFILLHAIAHVVQPQAPSSPAGGSARFSVHVLETMHLIKPPVYVLWEGVRATGREREKQRLLDALNINSPVLSPVRGTSSTNETAVHEHAQQRQLQPLCENQPWPTSQALRAAKQKLWLGESDEGFALAQAGFAQYRHDIEAIWTKTRGFLRSRRLRAERMMSAPPREGKGRER